MNKNLFDSMQKQMKPGPEVRAALAEKLVQPAKRRIPVRKYVAVAACAALVIGGVSMYRLYRGEKKWALITQNFHRDAYIEQQHLHSYVLVDGLNTGFTAEDATAELNTEAGAVEGDVDGLPVRDSSDAPSATESAPTSGGGAQNNLFSISQDEAMKLYDILCSHLRSRYGQQENFSPNWPDWYGGGYLDNDRPDHVARLTLVLVKDYDTPALRQEIYDFLGSDHVDFQSGKYALSHLLDLQKKIMDYPVIREVFASSWTDEEDNRLHLTLTEVTVEALITLAELDPEDDAIYVQVGRRGTRDVAVDMDEDAVMPGGAIVSEGDKNMIAEEPWVDSRDGAYYGVVDLPEQKQPAVVQSVPEEEDLDPWTAVTYDLETGETIIMCRDSDGSSEHPEGISGGTRAYNPDNPDA